MKALNSFFNIRPAEWWIGLLFAIGSVLFAAGSLMVLKDLAGEFIINLTYFVGSVFFTIAAYAQYYDSINSLVRDNVSIPLNRRHWFAMRREEFAFWSASTQFIGTVFFNFNCFDAFLSVGTIAEDVIVWGPDMIGSVLFVVSGFLAILEIGRQVKPLKEFGVEHWITFINFVGCIAFLLSALLAFITDNPSAVRLWWSTILTFIGSICFLAGALLLYFNANQSDVQRKYRSLHD